MDWLIVNNGLNENGRSMTKVVGSDRRRFLSVYFSLQSGGLWAERPGLDCRQGYSCSLHHYVLMI
jgi:hypothetical protein